MTTISISVKKNFFDRKKIIDRIGKNRARALARSGGIVRAIARRSIRFTKWKGYKTKRSSPGQPPKTHTRNKFSLKLILFAMDSQTDGVVIGPVRGNGQMPVPNIVEFGGPSMYTKWNGKTKRMEERRYTAKSRPFMGPAKQEFESQYPNQWRDLL